MVAKLISIALAKDSSEKSLFKLPEEIKLPKNKTIQEEQHIVYRQYEQNV